MVFRLLTVVFGLSLALPAIAQTPPPAAAAAASPAAPTLPSRARPLGDQSTWITLDDYPAAAYAELREGVVRVRLSIAPLGFVDGCTVVESSGQPDLDEATCRVLAFRAFFVPARDAAGVAVAGEFNRRVRWQHPNVPRPTPAVVPAAPVPVPAQPQ